MSKLAICNVGPIRDGLGTKKYLEFNGLTILIGIQGSGKSTVAKVFSSLCWLEKALVRSDLTKTDAENPEFFLNKLISFQGISGYFNVNSFIHYIGDKYEFRLEDAIFTVKAKSDGKYASPKIMYVPAERNFLASIDRPDLISKLPSPLKAFLEEYEDAKRYNTSRKVILPFGELKYRYEPKINKSYLVGNGFETDLINASSGYQSFVPLHLVTDYLARFALDEGKDTDKLLSVALERRLAKEINTMLDKIKEADSSISDYMLSRIHHIRSRFIYSAFVNIVEEPEQNLYPDSQRVVLFELLKALNLNAANKLIITTHSPYIINYMTLSLQAHRLYNAPRNLPPPKRKRLKKIVPESAAIDSNRVRVYDFQAHGAIKCLELEDGFIPDTNELNFKLEQINHQFSDLLDIEG